LRLKFGRFANLEDSLTALPVAGCRLSVEKTKKSANSNKQTTIEINLVDFADLKIWKIQLLHCRLPVVDC